VAWGTDRKTNDLTAVRAAAADLTARGFALCALDADQKQPTYLQWPVRPLAPEDFDPGDGVGILGGPISGRPGHALVIVDLDSPQAVRLADRHLPPTGMREGRPSKPNSHRAFMVPLASIPPEHESTAPMAAAAAVERYGHPGPRTLHYAKALDVLGTGAQAACPPTLHQSGETREWAGGRPGEPAELPYPELLRAVGALLAACGYRPGRRRAGATPPAPAAGFEGTPRVDAALRRRITRYMDAFPPAVSGEGGHRRTYRAACLLTWGFGLDPEVALAFLTEYNARCVPPWTPAELRHKVESAAAAADHRKPRGHLLLPGPRPRPAGGPAPLRIIPAKEAARWLR
jgi:hypothetical protein